ncbi:MAG: hypothetical protein FWH29_06580 [Methanobrevibacter sp.]|nr:hypothetical protein [Methanobrevibacter sp.]
MNKKIYITIGLIIGIIAVIISGVYFLSQEGGENCPVCGMQDCLMDHSDELKELLQNNPNNATIKNLIKSWEEYR